MMPSLLSLREQVGAKAACHALDVPRASFYRQLKPGSTGATAAAPPLALSQEERRTVLDAAHEQRFWDLSPYQIYATLLDEGVYYCSIREQRAQVLADAFRQTPARFKGKMPTSLALPDAVWINPPATKTLSPFAEGQEEGVLPPSATSGPAGSGDPVKAARSAPPTGGFLDRVTDTCYPRDRNNALTGATVILSITCLISIDTFRDVYSR